MGVVIDRDVNDEVGISVMMLLDEEKNGYLVTGSRYDLLLALRHTKEFRTIIKEYRDNLESLINLMHEIMDKERNSTYIPDIQGIIERVENLHHEWSDRLVHSLRYSCDDMLAIMVETNNVKEEEFLTATDEAGHTLDNLDFSRASEDTLGILSVCLLVTLQSIIVAMYSLYRVYKCTDEEIVNLPVVVDVLDDTIPDLGEAVGNDKGEAYATIAFDSMILPNTLLSLASEKIAMDMREDNVKAPSNSPEVMKYSLYVNCIIEPYLKYGEDWEDN